MQFVLQECAPQEPGAPRQDGHVEPGCVDAERLRAWRSALTSATVLPQQRVVVPASTGVDMHAVAEVLDELGLKLHRRTAWLEFDMRLHGHAKAMAECLRRHQKTKLQPWLCFSQDSVLSDGRGGPSPFLDNADRDQELFPELIIDRTVPEQALRSLVLEVLTATGWAANPGGSAVALKQYETAVGSKQAQAYLRTGHDYVSLDGVYWSEGRNILESSGVLIPKTACSTQVRSLAGQFADRVERKVRESYAVRLLQDLPGQPATAHGQAPGASAH